MLSQKMIFNCGTSELKLFNISKTHKSRNSLSIQRTEPRDERKQKAFYISVYALYIISCHKTISILQKYSVRKNQKPPTKNYFPAF